MPYLVPLVALVYVFFQCCVCIPPPVPGYDSNTPAVNTNNITFEVLSRRLSRRSVVCKSRYVGGNGAVYSSDPGGYRIIIDATCAVSDYALQLAATIIQRMTKGMPDDIFKRLGSSASVGVFTAAETLCVYPEYFSYANPSGCGSSCAGSTCSHSCTFDGRKYCSLTGAGGQKAVILDDNLMCNSADPYHGSANILVHEFAHTVHYHGLDSNTKSKISSAYAAARSAGTWSDQYAMSTEQEYFAVASSVFFNADHRVEGNGGPHMTLCGQSYCTSEARSKYNLYYRDPTLYNIIASTYDPVNPNQSFNIGTCTT